RPTVAQPTAIPVRPTVAAPPTAIPVRPTVAQPTPIPPTPIPPTPAPQMISPEEAAAIATAYVGGGTVERVRLEEEDGKMVYEVRFEDDSRVYVDAYTGQVVYARLR
ncbi:MAG TPA: PepSY domain-containing protein, partial [Herpetosiphonaceae bacterium]